MNLKQFKKLILISSISFIFIILALSINEKITESIIDSISHAFSFIFPVAITISIAFIVYVDNISTKLEELYEKFDANKIENAYKSFSILKKEIFSNIVLLVVVYILASILNAIFSYLSSISFLNKNYVLWAISAIIFSCFSVSAFAIFTQFKAFNTSVEYRELIGKNKKKENQR